MRNDGFNINIQKISFDGVSVQDVQTLINTKFIGLKLNVAINIDDKQFHNIQTQLNTMQKMTGKDVSGSIQTTASSLQEIQDATGKTIGLTETWNKSLGVIEQKTQGIKKGSTELEHLTTKTTTNYQKQVAVVKQLALFQEKMSRNIQGLSMRFKDGDINTRQITELRKEMSQLTAESFTPETRARVQSLFDNIVHGAKRSAIETRNASMEMQNYIKQHSIIQKQTIQQAMAPMFEETGLKARESFKVFEQHYKNIGTMIERQPIGKAIAKNFEESGLKARESAKTFNELFKQTEKGSHEFGKLGDEANRLTPNMDRAGRSVKTLTKDTKGLGMEILDAGRKFAQWYVIAQILMTPMRAVRDAISDIRELDGELTQLRKVTGETLETMKEFGYQASEIGIRMGATAQEVTKATVEFARLGMTIEQASMMAEKSILLGIVGNMRVEDASKALISTTKAFGIAVDEEGKNIERVIDLINEVGNSFAISQADIAVILQKSSSAMKAAGNTIEEAIAISVGSQEIVQDSKIVGEEALPLHTAMCG